MKYLLTFTALVAAAAFWLGRGDVAAAGTCAAIPERFQGLVEHACFGEDGAQLKLTDAGLRYCRGAAGPYLLAAWLVQQPQWQGNRTLRNVALEIRGHCWAALLPALRQRANPVDIEYFQAWPFNLFQSLQGTE